ncbi:MAG: hypothetical protein PSX71_00425 [bacterium]|nr:hypothetical protein [bacterium]
MGIKDTQEVDREIANLKGQSLTHEQLLALTASTIIENKKANETIAYLRRIIKKNEEIGDERLHYEELFHIMRHRDQIKALISSGIHSSKEIVDLNASADALNERIIEINGIIKAARAFSKGAQHGRTENAKKAARAKLDNDPAHGAKAEAKKLWQDWRDGKTIHKNCTAFAKAVTSALPVIESEETVKRWEREWRKESKKQALS